MTELRVKYFFESTGAGAGANACQDPQMVFFANSPLSELVWSQAEGLGVKYASSEGLVEKKTPLFWNTETFNIILDSPFNGVSFLSEGRKMENFKSVSDLGPRGLVTRRERDSRSCGEINFMNELNQGLDQKIISNIKCENGEGTAQSNKKSHVKRGPSNDDVSVSVFQPCGSKSNQEKSTKIAKSYTSSSKKEKSMETILKILNKGKEKVIYGKENTVKESDNSNESVESTGSIMSKRKRPFKFCNPNPSNSCLENKRFKREMHNKSSFMNWISSIASGYKASSETAMIKPLNVGKWTSSSSQKSNERNNNVKTITPFVPNGFGSFFHTLYRPNNTLSSCSNKKESFSLEKSSPNDANNNNFVNFGINSEDRSQDEIKTENPNKLNVESGNNSERKEEKGWACVIRAMGSSNSSNENKSRSNEEKGNMNSSNNDKSKSNEEKANINEKEGYLENIWISRLLPKEASSSKPRIGNSENNEGQSERKLKSNLNPIIPSNKRKETDCMASLFARKLGAIKHAEPSNLCSFQNLEKIEEVLEGSRSKSISKSKSPCIDNKRMVLWCEKKGKNVVNESSAERNFEWKEIGSRYNDNNDDKKGKGIIRNNDDNLLNFHNFIDETSAIFESVRRLRFSRMDVIRWMKSSIKITTLDGFYLRLRLSKLKQEIGMTGYHVGRINGTSGDKFLSVRVGRFTCLVEPHCVSNQDFLDDEMKAWWSAAGRADFSLPSKEELDRKLKERHLLGF